MRQIARNLTMDGWGFLQGQQYLIFESVERDLEDFSNLIIDRPRKKDGLNF
jgi:hypothetical protein